MRTLAILIVLAAPSHLALGCSKESSAEARPSPAAATYTARGIVEELRSEGRDPLVIRHEAIDDFRDNDGKVVGMNAMTMPFTPAEDISLEGVGAGDKIQFTFEVRWTEDPRLKVTHVEKLPEGEKLELAPSAAHAH